MGGLSIWHWLIVLTVVALIFGTSSLKNIGKDLGAAVKGFKERVQDGQSTQAKTQKSEEENETSTITKSK